MVCLQHLGGKQDLNLAFQLSEKGILEKYGVKLLGSSIESIKKGEDREAFRHLMQELNEPVPESTIVHELEEALDFAEVDRISDYHSPCLYIGWNRRWNCSHRWKNSLSLVSGGLKESANPSMFN